MLKLQFLGAAGTVTGSKFLLTYGQQKFLIDCGLFQGQEPDIRRNLDPFPDDFGQVQAVLLTHAHIDHCGALPRWVKAGFRGPIYSTEPTRDLCEILLPDSARIHQLEAGIHGDPFYSEEDAWQALDLFRDVPYYQEFSPGEGVTVIFRDAGHILGSAWLEVVLQPLSGWNRSEPVHLVFSGDIGRGHDGLLMAPDRPRRADFLILESTYGDRLHPPPESAARQLAECVRSLDSRHSTLLIPAFAVQRSQDLCWMLEELFNQDEIPLYPVFLDSPMAVKATEVFSHYPDYLGSSAGRRVEQRQPLLGYPDLRLCLRAHQSREIQWEAPPKIVISASGMLEGGRILHHLRQHLSRTQDLVLLSGYQCEGTRGYQLQRGAETLEIDGLSVSVRAQVESLGGFSGHADHSELQNWLGRLEQPPQRTFLVHGEPQALEAHRQRLAANWNQSVEVPEYRETFVLMEELA